MNNKILSCLIAGSLALASPALARGGGGGGGHGGGMGGGGHVGGMGGGMHAAAMGGGMHVGAMGGGMRFGGMSGATHFSGSRFASAPFAHAGSSRFAFRGRDGFRHGFHHHRFNRFAFVGSYAAYDSCWRRVWTSYGPQWVDVCGDYGY
jgi:hypothetical protein